MLNEKRVQQSAYPQGWTGEMNEAVFFGEKPKKLYFHQ